MLASGSVEVSRGQTETVVDIEAASMPQYFYIRGFLVETDTLRPVCTSYESSLYTQEMQDFLSKTTEDFDADKVLNLDDDITNNFAVYNDDVILIPSGTGKNEVSSIDEAADTYVITDADVSMTSLQPGDTFAYEYETGQVLIVKIAEISVDGTTVTITGTDAALEDVFSYVKIDAEEGLGNAVIDPSTCGEGVTYEGLVDAAADSDFKAYGVDAGGSMEKAFRMKLDKKVESGAGSFTVSGGLDMKLTCSAKLYLSFSQQYVELKLDYSAKLGVSASGSGSIDVPLVTVGYMFCGVIVELTPSIVAEADASIALQGTLKGAVGFCATKNGMENLTSMPTLETEFKSQGSIFIGFSLEPRVKILTEKVASASLTAKVGVEVTAVLDYHRSESGEVLHTCSSCVDGDIYARVNLDAAAKLLNKEALTFRISMADEKEKVADFYYSVDHDEFGLSSCPYLSFRIQAAVTDTAGKPVSGAVIDGKYTTDENGKAEFYLPNGSYRLKTEKAGYPAGTYRLLVAGKAETIRILLKKSGGSGGDGAITIEPIEPVLPDDSTDTAVTQRQTLSLGDLHSGAITSDGSLYMWGYDWRGNLGDGTTTERHTPVKVLDNVVSVSLGYEHSGAITGDGNLYMWGRNDSGQLGDETTTDRLTPTKISLPGGVALPDGTKASALSVEAEAEPIAVNKADSVSIAGDVQEASFRDLTPEGIYQFYVAKSLTAERLLAPENLLYVAQAAADASGRLTVSYEPRETYEGAAVFVVGGAKHDIAGASVTVPTVSYAGGTQTILPQVTLDGRTLVEGRDYQLTGGFLVTAPGSYTLTVSGIGNYTGIVQAAYQVVCAHQYTETVTRQPTCTQAGERTLRCGICGDSYTEVIPAAGHAYTSEWTTDRQPTCTQAGSKSRHCMVCGASADVTDIPATGHNYQDTKVIKKATTTKSGKVKQTCSVCGASKTETIPAAKKTALSATALTYNGKNRTPGVTVTDAKGRKLKKGTDYTVSYPKSRKNVGKYTVTIKLKGKYSGTVKKTFTVKPKSTSVTKLSSSRKNITVKWKKQKKQTTGYEVQYSTSSKFTKKTTHTVRIAKNGTTSKKITGLKAKKKYYVRVRTYKTVRINKKSTRIYSDWSKAKKITTKK